MKTYTNFFFDLDETLLDFSASEKVSFEMALHSLGVKENLSEMFNFYQVLNRKLWLEFEQGLVSKEFLKHERFRATFEHFSMSLEPKLASQVFLDSLPESVVLIDGAVEILEWLNTKGEVGIITNGVEYVQHRRIENSALKHLISYVCVSEACGYAKPDIRFFEYTAKHAKNFTPSSTLVVGDRYDADIIGAHQFGVDSAWFPRHNPSAQGGLETYKINHLLDLKKIVK